MMPLENNKLPQETLVAVEEAVTAYFNDKIGCRTLSDKVNGLLAPFQAEAPVAVARVKKHIANRMWKSLELA